MTPDERNMLTDLANKIAQTPPPPRDQEAEDFIRAKIGSRPDALYLMTQTVLIQNLALQQAQEQLQQLQRSQPSGGGSNSSFLGQGQSQQRPSGGYAQGQYGAPPPQYAPQPQYAPPSPQAAMPSPAPGAAPSFLKGAAQTAAGVAAGALAFEGIQALFSHPGYGGGGGGFFGGGGGHNVEETVVNNYYDSPGDSGRDNYRDDYRDDSRDSRDSFASDTDTGGYDTSNIDDSTYDDSGSDGGSDDSGGDLS